MNGVRRASQEDVSRMVELSARKRREYELRQPVFWRRAAGGDEAQQAYFHRLLEQPDVIPLVHAGEHRVDGFLIARFVDAPPVYDPGGPTCYVDDFVAEDWSGAGRALLTDTAARAAGAGAVQLVVVSGHEDEPKRELLAAEGFSIASEWWVRA